MRLFRRAFFHYAFFLLSVPLAGNLTAQEGHPLKGSWIGEWTGNEQHGDFVLLVFDWDGKNITGVINPGTDNIAISQAALDPSDWSVTFSAETEVDNNTVRYEIEGKLDQLELPSRSLTGNWQSESGNGSFAITRQ